MIALRILVFIAGLVLVASTVMSAVKTFVVPRAETARLTRAVFIMTRRIFNVFTGPSRPYSVRDRVMARYAPITLMVLPVAWLILIGTGYAGMLWGLGGRSVTAAFLESGSSLLTLGFAHAGGPAGALLAFSEAALGLLVVALLIAYLPTMYAAFARREAAVGMLEVRAGTPPSAAEMIERFNRIQGLDRLEPLWVQWENWFVDVEESHTSLAPLVFFRSPHPDRSWVTAAGAVLDAASVCASTLDMPRVPQAELCIRAGYIALRRIADFFGISYEHDPRPTDPISIGRDEYDALYARLAEAGVPLRPDRDQAWRDFAGWRVNYDTPLLALATITMAPYAPWSSDRSPAFRRPRVFQAVHRPHSITDEP